MSLFYLFNFGGLALLILSSFAAVWNRRVVAREMPAPWQRLWRLRWKVGVLLGLLSVFSWAVTYPTTLDTGWQANGRFARGIPFIVGGGTHGVNEDMPHPIFLITLQLNFLFWLLLPQLVLWVTWLLRRGTTGV